jgi:uncharacterized protein (TIGR02598 family)
MDISAHSGHKPSNFGKRGGFSLVEIALAIGVLSFGMLATVGLLPVGMSTFHQAIDSSIGSQVLQRVVNDARQTDFSVLVTNSGNQLINAGATGLKAVRYFDYQGIELTSTGNYIYQVNTRIAPQTTLPNSAAVASLATVTVQIANNPGHQPITPNPQTNLWSNPAFNISTYSAMVARNNNK